MAAGMAEQDVDEECLKTKPQLLRLLKLRDSMIAGKCSEVNLVTEANAALRAKLDGAEAELSEMHKLIDGKDAAIQAQKREADRAHRAAKRLQTELDQRAGQEAAVGITAAQSTRLLKLLEQEEIKRELLVKEKDEAQAETRELRVRLRTADTRSAEHTADLHNKLAIALSDSATLRQTYSGVEQRIAELEHALHTAEQLAEDRLTAMHEEALRHKSQQYDITCQLQAAKDAHAKQADTTEGRDDMLSTLTQQTAALELALARSRSELAESQAALRQCETHAQEDIALAHAKIASQKEAHAALQQKLTNAGRTIAALVDKHQALEATTIQYQSDANTLRTQLQDKDARILQLENMVDRLKESANTEKTQRRLHKVLHQFNQQIGTSLLRDSNSNSSSSIIPCTHDATANIDDAGSVSNNSGNLNHHKRHDSIKAANLASGGVASTQHSALQQCTWSKRKLLMRLLVTSVLARGDNGLSDEVVDDHADIEVDGDVNSHALSNDRASHDVAETLSMQRSVLSQTVKQQQQKSDQAQHTACLDSCGITDLDMACIVRAFTQGIERLALNRLHVLDLRGNLITDTGACHLCALLQSPQCRLKRIDLRFNQISMQAVRTLAQTLEACGSQRAIQYVYVHKEGRIDALGSDPSLEFHADQGEGINASSNSSATVKFTAESSFSVVSIDCRDNVPSTTAHHKPQSISNTNNSASVVTAFKRRSHAPLRQSLGTPRSDKSKRSTAKTATQQRQHSAERAYRAPAAVGSANNSKQVAYDVSADILLLQGSVDSAATGTSSSHEQYRQEALEQGHLPSLAQPG